MQVWVIILFLLSVLQQTVDGCKKTCKPKRLRCPAGFSGWTYEIDTFEQLSTCWVVNGADHIHNLIANNCWPENVAKAKACLKDKARDTCTDPTMFKPGTDAHFAAACHGHDVCYHCKFYSSWSREKKQKHCDDVFYDNMRKMCDGGSWYLFGSHYITCQAWALIAYTGVRARGTHNNEGCWLEGLTFSKRRKRRSLDNNTIEDTLIAARNMGKDIRVNSELFEFDQSYKEFEGSCWDLFGHNTDKIWNETESVIGKCKTKKNKKNSVKCWRKIRNNLKIELEKAKASLIECIDIESSSSNRIDIDTIIKKDTPTREDNLMLKKIDLWKRAEKNKTHLLDLEDEGVDIIESTWEQNERKWNRCWKKSIKIARKKGIEMARGKIRSCWKIDMDGKFQEELSIST